MNLRNVFYASLIVLAGSLAACFGGGGSSSADDSAQVAALQQTVTALQATVAGLTTSITTMQKNQTADEKTISVVRQFGHIPGVNPQASASDIRFGFRTNAVAQAVDTTDYGICTGAGDMGQHVGSGLVGSDGAATALFKNCTNNEVAYNIETGAVGFAPVIWYMQANCQGAAIEFEADGSYDRATLQGGIIFMSPLDNSVNWVQPLQPGVTPQQITVASHATNSVCGNSSETHIGYPVVPNVTDGNSGTGVPNGGVPNTFVYN